MSKQIYLLHRNNILNPNHSKECNFQISIRTAQLEIKASADSGTICLWEFN